MVANRLCMVRIPKGMHYTLCYGLFIFFLFSLGSNNVRLKLLIDNL